MPGYLKRLHLKVSLSKLLLKVYRSFVPGLQASAVAGGVRASSRYVCISQGSNSAGLEHALSPSRWLEGLDQGSGLVEQLVHALLRDARLVGHLMKRGHVLQVGDAEVGSAHALLDAPKERVVGLMRELLQDLQGLAVQLGQRALGVLETVLHPLGHDS